MNPEELLESLIKEYILKADENQKMKHIVKRLESIKEEINS